MLGVRDWLGESREKGMALGLENTKAVLDNLELFLENTHIVHVAGSNGKGTTCAILGSVLSLSGLRVCIFSSPHVARIEERIRIDGIPVAPDAFDSALEAVRTASEGRSVTFFEITFLAAMQCASDANVDVLILETGLGGRLDATRCAPADSCILTSISLEHTDILGSTLGEIASEKAAIARPGSKVIIRDPEDDAAMQAILAECKLAGNPEIGEDSLPAQPYLVQVPSGLTTKQEAALLVMEFCARTGMPCEHIGEVLRRLQWPARMQYVATEKSDFHPLLMDAAHNPSGLKRVMPELEAFIENYLEKEADCWTLVLGTSPQDDLDIFLEPIHQLIEKFPPTRIILTEPQGGRYPAVAASELQKRMPEPIDSVMIRYPENAIYFLEELDFIDVGLVVSIGSLYLQGNLIGILELDDDESLSLLVKP